MTTVELRLGEKTLRHAEPGGAGYKGTGLPFRRAIARLVPSVCGKLPPREGGLHARLSHCIVHHAMAKQLPLS